MGKAASMTRAAKAESKVSLPYNVLKTEKLKESIFEKVEENFRNEKARVVQFLKSRPIQIMLNQGVQAVQNSKALKAVKNVVNPKSFKNVFENTYQDVIKSPLAKTKSWINRSYKSAAKKIGELKVPTSIEVKQAAGPNGLNFINVSTERTQLKDLIQSISGNKQDTPDASVEAPKGTGNVFRSEIDEVIKNDCLIKNIPAPNQQWKEPVKVWIRDIYEEKFGRVLKLAHTEKLKRKPKQQEKLIVSDRRDDEEELPF